MIDQPARQAFGDELDQLRLQVEVMGVRVDQNLERMRGYLGTGDPMLAQASLLADDEIDAMNVSLTERCYDLLAREAPVASDLRFVVSVMRVLGELERIGDLSLRVAKVGPEAWDQVRRAGEIHDLLTTMADAAVDQYRHALRAWSSLDLPLAEELAKGDRSVEMFGEQLTRSVLRLDGPEAVAVALNSVVIGKALDRIADHAAIIGSRLRYLITGDAAHLAAEIR